MPELSHEATPRQKHFFFFHPGEAARGLPRWQFGLEPSGRYGAVITYPIAGLPWRRHRQRTMEATLDAFTTDVLFTEVAAMPTTAQAECLPNEVLWADHTEKCNATTRDCATNTLCLTLYISDENGAYTSYFCLRDDSAALLSSVVFQVVRGLLAPYLGLFPVDEPSHRARNA